MKYELKKEFIERMRSELSLADFEKYLNSLNNEDTHGLALNLHKLKNSTIDINYVVDKFNGKVIYSGKNFVYITYDKNQLLTSGISPGKDALYHAGLYYIQEPSASKVLYDVVIKPSDFVLDLCASPGGKTAEILFSLDKNAGGFLISNEIEFNRAKILSSNIERLGFENYAITNNSSKELVNCFNNSFNIIIVDAPCSGEGMFRKSHEARRQWSQKLIVSLSNLQKTLVDDAYSMLTSGGTLIYSTCTFAKEEDEMIVDYLINKYEDLVLYRMEKNYPFNSIGEGQFFAIFKKDGKKINDGNVSFNLKLLKSLRVVRTGVELYMMKNKTKIPTHASTHIDDISFENTIDLGDEKIYKYLRGESIKIELPGRGFYKVTYKNLGVGLGKYSDGELKNHYPKGLRNN